MLLWPWWSLLELFKVFVVLFPSFQYHYLEDPTKFLSPFPNYLFHCLWINRFDWILLVSLLSHLFFNLYFPQIPFYFLITVFLTGFKLVCTSTTRRLQPGIWECLHICYTILEALFYKNVINFIVVPVLWALPCIWLHFPFLSPCTHQHQSMLLAEVDEHLASLISSASPNASTNLFEGYILKYKLG